MQQGDYSSAPYHQYPHLQNPNPIPNSTSTPTDLQQTPYASAPPFSGNYVPIPSDYPSYPPVYPSYSQNPDHLPVSPAPTYTPSPNPNIQSFNLTPQPSPFPTFESHVPFQSTSQQQSYYPPYDQHQTAHSYAPSSSSVPNNPTPIPTPNSNSQYSDKQYAPAGSSVPAYENPYDNSVKFDQGSGYADNKYGSYSQSRSGYGSDLYGKRTDSGVSRNESTCVDGYGNSVKFDQGSGYADNKYGSYSQNRSGYGSDLYGKRTDSGVSRNESTYVDGYGDGVYAYQGGKAEPYGARGTAPKSSTWTGFDDYGRPINFPSGKDAAGGSNKIVRATPKVDTQEDIKSGVQKFRVKLLAESIGQTATDVLCQIGLDGIRMLDPNTGRILRIYPLETITKCEVTESSTLAIWSKSSVDIEPRRIRLQSNSYTTNTLLDTVTAATVQFKEMGGRSRPPDSFRTSEQSVERKKGFGDWMNSKKPVNVEKDHWVPDEAVSKCTSCGTDFSAFVRKHHCRNCGDIFCDKCTHGRVTLTSEESAPQVRVCDRCMAEVTQRLTNAKEAASKPAGFLCHEDLAKKLQEEMERNRRSSGSRSDGPGKQRMKEVACPTCTVHLQVAVPPSGSETIECGVCQNPFLVGAH